MFVVGCELMDDSLRCILLVNLGFEESIIPALIGCI